MFPCPFFFKKGARKNGAQCCFTKFDSSKFFVKAVFILIVSFALSNFHKSSPTLLQQIYFLSCACPINESDQRWTWTWIYILCHSNILMDLDFVTLLNTIWIEIDNTHLNFFATFSSVFGLQVAVSIRLSQICWDCLLCLFNIEPCLRPVQQVCSIVHHVNKVTELFDIHWCHWRSQGAKGLWSTNFLSCLVILCFEKQRPKQKNVARLKSNILVPQILGWLLHWLMQSLFLTQHCYILRQWFLTFFAPRPIIATLV